MELWNPREPIEIDPHRFEELVVEWLRKSESSFKVTHQARIQGNGGEYALDALAEATFFGGAKITILIECKKHTKPVNRDTIHSVHSKMQSLCINKAIVFSTSGYQKGAIEFATQFGIGLVTVKDGAAIYQTRSAFQPPREMLPNWLPEFAGELLSATDEVIHVSTLTSTSIAALRAFLIRNW